VIAVIHPCDPRPEVALCPICPYCEERGLHATVDACIQALQLAIRLAREHAPIAGLEDRARGPAPQFLRRDRCDLPSCDLPQR
jgi:hypothetical protein